MSDDDIPGPIDFVLLEFPDQEPTGQAAAPCACMAQVPGIAGPGPSG